MGLIGEASQVYDFLRDLFECFPVAIKLLIYGTFGLVIFFAIIRGLGR